MKLGISHNPYLFKYYNDGAERKRIEKKNSSGFINSIWLQFGTDIKLLESEINYLKDHCNNKRINVLKSINSIQAIYI